MAKGLGDNPLKNKKSKEPLDDSSEVYFTPNNQEIGKEEVKAPLPEKGFLERLKQKIGYRYY